MSRNLEPTQSPKLKKPSFRIRYKICEIRPPSIEKFLDTDGFSLDASAPAVTMPAAEIASPFDSRNTMFGRDVFWSLVPLPMLTSRYAYFPCPTSDQMSS